MTVVQMRAVLAEKYSQRFVDRKSDAEILAIYAKYLHNVKKEVK
jgi:hypothetical protein